MIAFREKRLDIDKPANDFLTGWQLHNPYAKTHPVTVRLLLEHAAGVTGVRYLGYLLGQKIPNTRQVLSGQPPANTAAVTVVRRPNTKTVYSPFGYTVLQAILEDTYRQPFAKILNQLVLKPFGMNESSFGMILKPIQSDAVALPYDSQKWKPGVMKPISNPPPTYAALAAGGLWTTPTDLAKFMLGFQAALAGEVVGGFTPTLAEEMMTHSSISHNWGLGFEVNVTCNGSTSKSKTDYFTHSGQNAGYVSLLVGSRHGQNGVVIMVNSGPLMDYSGKVRNYEFLQKLASFIAKKENWPDC